MAQAQAGKTVFLSLQVLSLQNGIITSMHGNELHICTVVYTRG